MPPTILLVGTDQPTWRDLHAALQQRRDVRIADAPRSGAPAVARAAAASPDILLIDAEMAEVPLLPLVRDLHVASPRSGIIVLGTAESLDSVTILAISQLGLASYLVWDGIDAGTIARCAILFTRDGLLAGSPTVWQEVLAPLERRRGPRAGRSGRAFEPPPHAVDTGHAPALRATLWEENADLTAILHTVCALAGVDLAVVSSAEALLAAAAHAGPADYLIIDCSRALPSDMERCTTIVTRTAILIHIIHPRPEIIDGVKAVARGEVVGLTPDLAGLTLLEKLRLRAAISPAAAPVHPRLTVREMEMWRLVAARHPYTRIAAELGISASTVKTHMSRIRVKLELDDAAKLAAAYERLTRG